MSQHAMITLLLFACTGLFTTTVVFGALWIAARERAIRAIMERGQRDNKPEVNAEMDRLMNMVDTIAIEVERISEGQRFTAKVLAERLDAPATARKLPEKSITPH